jgi:hypothetical protein
MRDELGILPWLTRVGPSANLYEMPDADGSTSR